MGLLLNQRGEYGKAEPYYRDALEMLRCLYPPEKYPNGHPDLAVSLTNIGALLGEKASTATRSRFTATPWRCAGPYIRRTNTPTATPAWP